MKPLAQIVFLFCLSLISPHGISQSFDLSKNNKLQVGIFTSWFSHFDGNPMVQTNYTEFPIHTWLSNSKGVDFIYYFNSKNGLRLSINDINIDYLKHVIGPRTGSPGYIIKRDFQLINLEYYRKTISYSHLELFLSSGGVYRFGQGETALAMYGVLDILVENHPVNDFGFTLGTHAKFTVYKGLSVNFILNYLNYIYRKDTGNDINPSWDTGSSSQAFGISLGLAYTIDFSTIKH